jgi:hypothetical protein
MSRNESHIKAMVLFSGFDRTSNPTNRWPCDQERIRV